MTTHTPDRPATPGVYGVVHLSHAVESLMRSGIDVGDARLQDDLDTALLALEDALRATIRSLRPDVRDAVTGRG